MPRYVVVEERFSLAAYLGAVTFGLIAVGAIVGTLFDFFSGEGTSSFMNGVFTPILNWVFLGLRFVVTAAVVVAFVIRAKRNRITGLSLIPVATTGVALLFLWSTNLAQIADSMQIASLFGYSSSIKMVGDLSFLLAMAITVTMFFFFVFSEHHLAWFIATVVFFITSYIFVFSYNSESSTPMLSWSITAAAAFGLWALNRPYLQSEDNWDALYRKKDEKWDHDSATWVREPKPSGDEDKSKETDGTLGEYLRG